VNGFFLPLTLRQWLMLENLIYNKKLKNFFLEGVFVFLLGLALGHAGPYGTYDKLELFQRLLFWVIVITLPWMIFKALYFLTKRVTPADLSNTLITIFLVPIQVLIGSAVITAINLNIGLYGQKTFFQVWPYAILLWLTFAFLIIIPMTLIGTALAKEERKSGVTNMLEFFHHKLPEALATSQLLALKAEDHYLRVITDNGNALILMKFSDALAALNGYPGIQTHRSWWVASRELQGREILNTSTHNITLSNNLDVPVSRRKRKLVNNHIKNIGSL